MKFFMLYILFYFHFATEANETPQCDYCNFTCSNGDSNNVMVQTAFNEVSEVNEPFQNDIIAHVYYKCNTNPDYSLESSPNYRYLKVCGNGVESCNNTLCGQISSESSWGEDLEKIPDLNVSLILPGSVESIKIKTSDCDSKPMIVLFKINNEVIDYDSESQYYKYNDSIFESLNLRRMPITLEIGNVTNVVFNVTRVPGRNCTAVVKEFCPDLCIGNQVKLKRRCKMTVDYDEDVEIETESESRSCKFKAHVSNGGMCELMKSIKDNPCEYICIDLPNCSFMCVKKMGSRYTETGYKEKIINSHTRYFGSRNWTIDNIPEYMVYVNECEMSNNLCTGGEGCKDKPVGFQCFNGEINKMECKSLRNKNRFVHCPNDTQELVNDMESKYELLEKYENDSTNKSIGYEGGLQILWNSLKTFIEILKIRAKLQNIKTTTGLFPDDGYKIFNVVDSICRNTFRLYPDKQQCIGDKDGSYYACGVYLNKTEDTYSIPMPANNKGKDKEFVNFTIEDVTNRTSNKEMIATFIRYKDIDPNNETFAVKLLESKTKIKPISEPYEFMFKNSDMISLSLNQKMNTTIRFKLRMQEIRSPSWHYSFHHLCGYLVPESYWNWSTAGCTTQKTKDDDFYCECNHLSNFGMLTGVAKTNEYHAKIFHYLSIVGGIINMISLILFLIFLLLINSRDKLRIDQLNIAICLLCGCTLFFFGYFTSLNDTVCKISGIVTHFLMLAAFVWKLILGVNVVRMITLWRYQNVDWMVKYRMIILGIAYAIPLIIVTTSASLYSDKYENVGDHTCWIGDQTVILLVFLTPIGIILAINLIVLFYVALVLIRNYINTRQTKVNKSDELLVFLQLVVSMGLTWVPLCFSVKYLAAMYIWLIFYPLQSLMMLLFVVVINRENRKKVATYLKELYSFSRSKSVNISNAKSALKSRSVHSNRIEPTKSLSKFDKGKGEVSYKDTNCVPMNKI